MELLHIWKWNSRQEVICEKEIGKQMFAISQVRINQYDINSVCPICLSGLMEARKRQAVI
jgi:hypothetical protein